MKQLVYFFMIGFAFTALQVATVADGDDGPDCETMGAPGSAARTMCEGKTADGDVVAKPSFGERVKSFFGVDAKDALPPTGEPGEPPVDVEIVDTLGGGNATTAGAIDDKVDAARAVRVQECLEKSDPLLMVGGEYSASTREYCQGPGSDE
jgi:hypothetical protein